MKANAIPDRCLSLLVVGLGPAGVACTLQAARDGLDVLAVSDEPPGGLLRAARRLDNLPGCPGASGLSLCEQMALQLAASRAAQLRARVERLERSADGAFSASLDSGERIRSRCVCLATGTRPRPWDVPVEGDGRRVHRDARSLPEALADRRVAVLGGGEAALDTALWARDRGAEAVLLARGEKLRSAPGLEAEAREAGVIIQLESRVERAACTELGWALALDRGRVFRADELVVCIGRVPRDELLPASTESRAGLFLAGDLTRGRERYVATAMGEGQQAALAAAAFVQTGG
ncbi:MAG: NAD(P)/FAD-dependent oxidoreductase [Deltaproteobacteria bacterium]|nr:NAD(P)/FAD-dependent oxidoreductase [Deltaproteobacteria bacterium]